MEFDRKSYGQNDLKIAEYVANTFLPEDDVMRQVRERSVAGGLPQIHVSPFDARLLQFLVAAINARKCVEIGTLAGYSGLAMIRGMGLSGKLYTFEVDSKHAETARDAFVLADVLSQVDLRIGKALDNLPSIVSEGPFDLVFIDADKEAYPEYLNWAEENLRVGGMVIGDNTFAFGRIAGEGEQTPSVEAIRNFNAHIAESPRFLGTILPTGEGLTVGIKVN